jgi:hypothetical protein
VPRRGASTPLADRQAQVVGGDTEIPRHRRGGAAPARSATNPSARSEAPPRPIPSKRSSKVRWAQSGFSQTKRRTQRDRTTTRVRTTSITSRQPVPFAVAEECATSDRARPYQAGHEPGDEAGLVRHHILLRADSAGATHGFLSGLTEANIEYLDRPSCRLGRERGLVVVPRRGLDRSHRGGRDRSRRRMGGRAHRSHGLVHLG